MNCNQCHLIHIFAAHPSSYIKSSTSTSLFTNDLDKDSLELLENLYTTLEKNMIEKKEKKEFSKGIMDRKTFDQIKRR